MSEEKPANAPERPEPLDEELSEAELAELDASPALSTLLKRSFAEADDVPDAELLASVQRKLRTRSKGKFYGDGWSTTGSRLNYTVIALVMLATVVAVYLALGPTSFSLR